MICHIKLGQVETAQKVAKEDPDDKTLFPYYAKAALHYHWGDKDDALNDIAEAMKAVSNRAKHAPWNDTLLESGYIESVK